jgi:hypothetical protein
MIATTGTQCLCGGWVVQQRKQKVFNRDELVALLPGFDKGHVQTDFKFLRDHSILLHDARQRMLVFPCKAQHLLNLRGGHVARINAADAASFHVNFEHDLCCLFSVLRKKLLQHMNHKVHRGESRR